MELTAEDMKKGVEESPKALNATFEIKNSKTADQNGVAGKTISVKVNSTISNFNLKSGDYRIKQIHYLENKILK